jgi:drug/metabolite transporter (DMT)-like permease
MVGVFLIESYIYKHTSFIMGFALILCGLVISGSTPLFFPKIRKQFEKNMHKIYPAQKIFIGIEMANLIALGCSQMAINLGDPSLVSAVQTTIPAHTFFISIILYKLFGRFGNQETRHELEKKLLAVLLMFFGVLIISY